MRRETDIAGDVTLAEAAAWLTRLQGESRTAATEAAFKAWVTDPAHARAFARVTDIWNVVPGAALHDRGKVEISRRRRLPALVAAALLVVALIGGGTAWVVRDPVYATAIGQQQTVSLSDGTRVALNTDTKIVVDYSSGLRRVRLERGEAMFEVAKNPKRPFVVAAAAEEIRALGTTFVVRREAEKVAVTLIEGRVEVRQRTAHAPAPVKLAVLAPGERLTTRPKEGAAVDRPNVETATAWRRGEVMFDDASLAEAAAELNRYGGKSVTVADPRLSELRVSGVFKTADPAEFARTMAALHGLRMREADDAIVLTR